MAKIREYSTTDFDAARNLWVQLTQYHRDIYDDPMIGGDDPGAQFAQYLEKPNLAGPWVAEVESVVVGLTGLLMDGVGAEIEPVVVNTAFRSKGIGTQLIEYAEQQALDRGVRCLIIRPVARNAKAMHCFYSAGFTALGQVEMVMFLDGRNRRWRPGVTIHGRELKY